VIRIVGFRIATQLNVLECVHGEIVVAELISFGPTTPACVSAQLAPCKALATVAFNKNVVIMAIQSILRDIWHPHALQL
jgi:hypothetical protein